MVKKCILLESHRIKNCLALTARKLLFFGHLCSRASYLYDKTARRLAFHVTQWCHVVSPHFFGCFYLLRSPFHESREHSEIANKALSTPPGTIRTLGIGESGPGPHRAIIQFRLIFTINLLVSKSIQDHPQTRVPLWGIQGPQNKTEQKRYPRWGRRFNVRDGALIETIL